MSKVGDLQIKFEVDPQFADFAAAAARVHMFTFRYWQYKRIVIKRMRIPIPHIDGREYRVGIFYPSDSSSMAEWYIHTLGLDGVE